MDNKSRNNESAWAKPVDRLQAGAVSEGAMNLNVTGRQLTGPLQGFGQMWQKTYSFDLNRPDLTPQAVIAGWKENFAAFWPQGNYFFGENAEIAPGNVAVLNLAMPGGMVISTGIRVIYADDDSFSFMTPEGHMFAGMITFSAEEIENGVRVQIQALIRAGDPLYEIGCRLGFAHKKEDEFWIETLHNLAAHFKVAGRVSQTMVCVDPQVQWGEAGNVWQNAAIRSSIFSVTRRLFGGKKRLK